MQAQQQAPAYVYVLDLCFDRRGLGAIIFHSWIELVKVPLADSHLRGKIVSRETSVVEQYIGLASTDKHKLHPQAQVSRPHDAKTRVMTLTLEPSHLDDLLAHFMELAQAILFEMKRYENNCRTFCDLFLSLLSGHFKLYCQEYLWITFGSDDKQQTQSLYNSMLSKYHSLITKIKGVVNTTVHEKPTFLLSKFTVQPMQIAENYPAKILHTFYSHLSPLVKDHFNIQLKELLARTDVQEVLKQNGVQPISVENLSAILEVLEKHHLLFCSNRNFSSF